MSAKNHTVAAANQLNLLIETPPSDAVATANQLNLLIGPPPPDEVSGISTLAAASPSPELPPLRPCTACANLQWVTREWGDGDHYRQYRTRICTHYHMFGSKPEPQKACRCIHFKPGR